MEKNKFNLLSIVINIVIPILAIFLAVVFSEVQSKVGWVLLAISLGLVFAIYLSLLGFINLKLKYEDNDYRNIINLQKNTLDEAYIKFRDLVIVTEGNFISTENLANRQSSDGVKEVWVVSCDISIDAENEIIFNMVNNNVDRGVSYKYFIPRTMNNLQCVTVINNKMRNHNKIEFIYISDDYFKLSPNINYIIFNPTGSQEQRDCYLGITLSVDQDYNIRLCDTTAKNLVGTLMEIQSNHGLHAI